MSTRINIFDFDGTLTKEPWGNILFLEQLGYPGGNYTDKFIADWIKFYKSNGGTKLESFMSYINNLFNEKQIKVSEAEFMKSAEWLTYNPGVFEFFQRSKVKNYMISGGFPDFLRKLEIGKYFEGIYGTQVRYDKDNFIIGIGEIMTEEGKILAVKDILKKNNRAEDDCKDVFFIGDGLTDVPAMRFVHENGGKAVFVYQPGDNDDLYHEINTDKIIDFRCVADYNVDSELCKILLESPS